MSTPVVTLDTRGLEPPEPMVLILEALTTLPPGTNLQASTDRRPIHLYPLIEQRGFRAETTPAQDHGFVTVIRRMS